MPIPFILAGLGAIATAIGTGTAAVATVATLSVATIGGLSITVGGIVATATALGVAGKIFSDVNDYSSSYISDSEKEFERNRLKEQLREDIRSFEEIYSKENSESLKVQIKDAIQQAQGFKLKMEYFNAINVLNNYKLVYAEHKSSEKLAKEAERIAKKLIEVREETINLRR